MADFSVSGIIEGDSSGFQEALNQATSALSSFASTAAAVFGGEELAGVFDAITGGIGSIVSGAVSAASEFQRFSTVAGSSLNSTAEGFDAAVASFSNGAAAAGGAGAAAQNALLKYQEKVKEIQENIAEVMSGQNIIDAQSKFADQLASIEENYVAKVASIQQQIQDVYDNQAQTHTDKVQSMNDTLSDMQSSHDNTMADKKEAQQQQVDAATSELAKKALQDKFDKENQLTEDSFHRQYATKKAEEERSIAESDAKAKAAADKKVATLTDQLAKENKLHDEHVAKLNKQESEQIAKLEADNTKKLAMYKQELGDEERAFQESQAKRGGGGGKAGGAANMMGMIHVTGQASGEWGVLGENVSQVNKQIDEMSQKTPFTKMELEEAAQRADNVHLNFGKIGPIIADLGAAKGVAPMQTLQAVIEATHGRTMALRNEFGITGDTLNYVLGKTAGNTKFTYNEILQGLQKVNEQAGYTGAAEKLGNTYQGQLMKVKNSLTDIAIKIMGLDTAGNVQKGGLFDELTKGIQRLAQFLEAHQKDIVNFVKNAVKGFESFGKAISDNWGIIKPVLEALGAILAVVFAATVITAIVGIISAIVAFVSAFVAAGAVGGVAAVIGTAIAAIGGPITLIVIAVVALGYLFITHFNAIKNIVNTVIKFIVDHFTDILNFIAPGTGTLVQAIAYLGTHWKEILNDIKSAISGFISFFGGFIKSITDGLKHLMDFAKTALSYLNPFAKHSPSLVDQVRDGVDQIKRMYGEVAGLQIQAPNLMASYSPQGTQVYNYTTNSTPNLSQTNTFNITGQANADNIAEHLGFQLEHYGIV